MSQMRAAAKIERCGILRTAPAFGVSLPRVVKTRAVEILFSDEYRPALWRRRQTVRADSNGSFVPILKSVLILRSDLRNRPSDTEAFFGHGA